MTTDTQALLADYVKNGSEPAFRELVARYLDLVYATAVRLVDGDTHRAEDVAQVVFSDLARMAAKLTATTMLGGWLHRHTCFVARTVMRGERRRQARERRAVEMKALNDPDEAATDALTPILDEAINELGADDRDVILLRFFEGRNLRSVGEALGVTENVAQKRAARALEELGVLLKRRGVALSAAVLARNPYITFHLTDLTLKEAYWTNAASYPFEAKGTLAVAGVTNQIAMPVELTPLDDGRIKISGSVPLRMTDYGIQPPVLVGLLTTGDEVEIKFDWPVAPSPER